MLPVNPSQIPKIYAKALKLQNAGKGEDALKQYSVILNVNPRIAEVHFQVGRIFSSANLHAKAVEHLKIAASLKPSEAAIWTAYGDAVSDLMDNKETAECLASAKAAKVSAQIMIPLQDKLSTNKTKSNVGIGAVPKQDAEMLVALTKEGKFADAEKLAIKIRKRHPNVALIANVLANAQAQLGKTDAAIEGFKTAIKLDPNYAEAHNNYGRLLLASERPEEAMTEVRTALKLAPGMALAHHNLGAIHAVNGDRKEAIRRFRKAISLRPDAPDTYRMLGNMLSKEQDYYEAEAALQKAIKLNSRDAESYLMLALAQVEIGKHDAALKNFNKSIELAPSYPSPHKRLAIFHQSAGEFEKAEASARKAIELDPEDGENYRVMLKSLKLKADDPLIQDMINRFNDPKTSDVNRQHLGFALSKVMEDLKKYDQVFKYLNVANALMRKEFPYDIAIREKEVAGVMAFFGDLNIPELSVANTSDYAPIFVTGMPRSGTTLVEQIISSHSLISGAGEVGYGAREAQRLMLGKDGVYKTYNDLADTDIASLGHDYEAHMRRGFPDAIQVSDKSIQTYTFMGLIKLALPKSRMIIVRREPRDNLLSIYKNRFIEGTHLYGNNLSDLGAYYKLFLKLVAFWQEKVPDWFYVVDYENLIANTEEESRKLIAACGLEWEDQCLDFHKNSRRVDTHSVYQVRQPIYSSSLKAWQRYEDELADLFEALK